MAYLFTCPLPESDLGKVPQIVTIVAKPCELATNALRVQHAQQAKRIKKIIGAGKENREDNDGKKTLAVCVKGMAKKIISVPTNFE